MNYRLVRSFLLGCLCIGWQSQAAFASGTLDASSVPFEQVPSLDAYLHLIQSEGGIVIIDWMVNSRIKEKPVAEITDNIKSIVTPFYQLSFSGQICLVEPKEKGMRSDGLTTVIPSFSVKNSTFDDAIISLGKKAGTSLSFKEPHATHKLVSLDIKNETVEQILVAMAASYGSSRIVISGWIDDHERRLPGVSTILFQ